jgi:hypothetical protein
MNARPSLLERIQTGPTPPRLSPLAARLQSPSIEVLRQRIRLPRRRRSFAERAAHALRLRGRGPSLQRRLRRRLGALDLPGPVQALELRGPSWQRRLRRTIAERRRGGWARR